MNQERSFNADVTIGGGAPWDIRVNRDSAYDAILRRGLMGAAESYVDGDWDCERIDELVYRLTKSGAPAAGLNRLQIGFASLRATLKPRGGRKQAREMARTHYDLGNDLFEAMLGRTMAYSCGYWNAARTLDVAQEQKLDLICRKIGLAPGMNLLDIGGGWGSLVRYAAEHYGICATMITVSQEQAAGAEEFCKGLPVEVRVSDYRDLKGTYDRVVSVGMFEHVGKANYRKYMTIARQSLADGGLFLLHTIGSNITSARNNPWIEKHIFSTGWIPSIRQIGRAIEGLFVMEDWHNFGADYDRTLTAWYENFASAWPELKEQYGERFFRMWRLYLLGCAGAFRSRDLQLWQIVLSKHGLPGGYRSVR